MTFVPHGPSVALLRIATLTAAALMATVTPASAGAVSKVSAQGASALVSGYDSTGCVWFYLSVNRTSSKAASQTWLYYDVYDVCAQHRVASGWGFIPDTAFRVGSKNAVLKLNVLTTATFYTEGATGAISLTFTPTGTFQQTFSGHTALTYLDRVVKSHGWWSYAIAQVSGTVITETFATVLGEIGEAKQREIQIERAVR